MRVENWIWIFLNVSYSSFYALFALDAEVHFFETLNLSYDPFIRWLS